ncbi:hypothetical protein H7169_01475 [Candidatus Gracilibacteria bacterium]|nr:hypothetical protein [Candidatus Gracilibacteria bacterium]
MVKSRLADIRDSSGVGATTLGEELNSLNVTAMHRIQSKTKIDKICHEIISSVSDLLLVRIDEGELEGRKRMKKNDARLLHTEDTLWGEGIRIRHELMSKGKRIRPPRGWLWYDTDDNVIGCIYQKPESEGYEVFVHRDIADNPHGSILLISAMRKKIKKLIPKSQ